jgi:hypothetical protein
MTIFVMLFISYCYFLQNTWNWNSVPRIAMGISLTEENVFNINKFKQTTGDKAYYKGNYYSDKAPGMTFTALPLIAATKLLLDAAHIDYRWVNGNNRIAPSFSLVTQVSTIFTSGLFTALAAVVLFFVTIQLGAGLGGATFGALTFGLATQAWGWATTFFGHSLAASTLFMGLASVIFLLCSNSRKRDMVIGFTAGALLSWAVVVDYTSAPVSVLIAVYGVISARKWDSRRLKTVLLSAVAGGIIFILPLPLYNYAVYGDIFSTGYSHLIAFPGMKEGLFGINVPKWDILAKLLLDSNKGIIWFSPILILTPYAIYKQWKTPGQKGLAITIGLISVYYLIWTSGFTYWSGGGSTGVRYLTPMLPFLCLSLALLWENVGRVFKIVLVFLFGISFLISLMCVSVSMFILRDVNGNIISEYIFPKFLEAQNLKTSMILRFISHSLDGSSHWHLLPLYIILVTGFIYVLWEIHRSKNKDYVAGR